MEWLFAVLGAVAGLLIGGAIVFFVPFFKKQRAHSNAKKIVRDAEIKAEHITKNAQLDGKQIVYELKQEANKEIQERKAEVASQENKLMQREQNIDRRDQMITQKEAAISTRIPLRTYARYEKMNDLSNLKYLKMIEILKEKHDINE